MRPGFRSGWNRVDSEHLRQAILEGDALVPLITAAPETAARILQMAMIDRSARSRHSWFEVDRGLGVTDAPHWFTPVPQRGPFLAFLQLAPDTALDVILHVLDHATERWREGAAAEDFEARFEAVIGGDPVELTGDFNVMHWHRGSTHLSAVLSSALMAVEAYCYRRIDAGESVEHVLERLLASQSAAAFGLLAEIACYQPELLKGPLSPLVSSASLLVGDRAMKVRPNPYALFPGLSDRGLEEQIAEWINMPHRKRTLIECAMPFVLSGEALTDEMADARARWATEGERWAHLIAQTDPASWRKVNLEGGVAGWEYDAPAQLKPEIEQSSADLNNTVFWLHGPNQLRDWLDRGVRPNDDELAEFWKTMQSRLSEEADASLFADGIRSRADFECGVAALYVVCARDWLARDPDREAWCRRVLLAPFVDPPATHAFDMPDSVENDRWDAFCADALPRLLAEDPSDKELRAAVATLAVHRHYATVSRTFVAIANQPELRQEIAQLEHLSLQWSRYSSWRREKHHRETYADHGFGPGLRVEDLPDMETPTRAAYEGFVDGSLSSGAPDLDAFVAATPAGMLGRARGRYKLAMSLDLAYLLRARSHLLGDWSQLDDSTCERGTVFATGLARLVADSLVPDEGDKRVDGTPDESERWALELLARTALQIDAERARRVWEPVLAVGGPGHYWVDDFLSKVWAAGVEGDPWTPGFPALVKAMIGFADSCETWHGSLGWEDIDLAIVGLSRFGYSRMQDRHTALLSELQPEWADWVRPRVRGAWFARHVAHFLTDPVARPVVDPGLGWLADREQTGGRDDDDLDSALAEMLAKLFIDDSSRFRGQADAARSARSLLAALAGRGNNIALELIDRLG